MFPCVAIGPSAGCQAKRAKDAEREEADEKEAERERARQERENEAREQNAFRAQDFRRIACAGGTEVFSSFLLFSVTARN